MWTTQNRRRYDRSQLRYPSDLTDDEWSLVGPMIPSAKPGGNKRSVNVRAVLNGVMYVLSTGCQWRAVPKDLPPHSTVYDYLNCDAATDHARSHPSRAICGVPGTSRTRGQSDRRDHRRPERVRRRRGGAGSTAWL